MYPNGASSQRLAASITREASAHTYYTIRFLADRPLRADAYRAYAYFRWLDDELDNGLHERSQRIALVERQRGLIRRAYAGEDPLAVSPEERMLPLLIQKARRPNNGLQVYVHHMLAVMDFDARRRGGLVTGEELSGYTRHLSVAVTEALHFFIGHGKAAPISKSRYLAVSAAHITHMLRDTLEDIEAGYYNIPAEYLQQHRISPEDVDSDPYRLWVRSRVALARAYFLAGREYLAGVESVRCRMAARLYMARFERVLNGIERDGFLLRSGIGESRLLSTGLRV